MTFLSKKGYRFLLALGFVLLLLANYANAQYYDGSQTCGGAPCGYGGIGYGGGIGGFGVGLRGGFQTYGGYPGGFGGFYGLPRNTGALGAAVNNKFRITVWNVTGEKIEMFFDDQRLEVKAGDRKSKNMNGASFGTALLSSNFFPEEWLTEKMIGVRVVGDKGKPAFKKVTPVTPNQSSYSRRSLTLVVTKNEAGEITIMDVDDSEESTPSQIGRAPKTLIDRSR